MKHKEELVINLNLLDFPLELLVKIVPDDWDTQKNILLISAFFYRLFSNDREEKLLNRLMLHTPFEKQLTKAKRLFKEYPDLLLRKTTLNSPCGRIFEDVSILQHTIWSRNAPMMQWVLSKAISFLPIENKKIMSKLAKQYQEVTTEGLSYTFRGKHWKTKHFSLLPLIKSLKTYLEKDETLDDEKKQQLWLKVGQIQSRLIPSVAINYTLPYVSMDLMPGINKKKPPSLSFYNLLNQEMVEPWYSSDPQTSNLGERVAVTRRVELAQAGMYCHSTPYGTNKPHLDDVTRDLNTLKLMRAYQNEELEKFNKKIEKVLTKVEKQSQKPKSKSSKLYEKNEKRITSTKTNDNYSDGMKHSIKPDLKKRRTIVSRGDQLFFFGKKKISSPHKFNIIDTDFISSLSRDIMAQSDKDVDLWNALMEIEETRCKSTPIYCLFYLSYKEFKKFTTPEAFRDIYHTFIKKDAKFPLNLSYRESFLAERAYLKIKNKEEWKDEAQREEAIQALKPVYQATKQIMIPFTDDLVNCMQNQEKLDIMVTPIHQDLVTHYGEESPLACDINAVITKNTRPRALLGIFEEVLQNLIGDLWTLRSNHHKKNNSYLVTAILRLEEILISERNEQMNYPTL